MWGGRGGRGETEWRRERGPFRAGACPWATVTVVDGDDVVHPKSTTATVVDGAANLVLRLQEVQQQVVVTTQGPRSKFIRKAGRHDGVQTAWMWQSGHSSLRVIITTIC